MRKRDIKQELQKYPCYEFKDGLLVRIEPPQRWYGVELHHFITTQWEQENPDKFLEVEHLQKLIFLPPQMHKELHSKHSRFSKKHGIEIKKLLFDWREYMISASKARTKSDVNGINLLRSEIEKLINKATEKGLYTAFKSGQIPSVIKEELIAAGFDIDEQPTGMKIMWG